MSDKSPTQLLQVYRVEGTGQVQIVVGVQRNGRVLIGEDTIEPGAIFEWRYVINDAAGIAALQRALEQARVDQNSNRLDTEAEAYVTNAMVAKATATFEAERDHPTDPVPLRVALLEALSATPLYGAFTTDIFVETYKAAEKTAQGTGIRAGLVAVARSRIQDGTIQLWT